MAAKKYYAVRKGKKTGIFSVWTECRAAVDGFPMAEYKGFATREEAEAYLEESNAGNVRVKKEAAEVKQKLLTYVDGSYNHAIKKYSFGCVFIVPDGRIYTAYGNGDNPQSLRHRNVTGEMLGAMYAVRTAMYNGFSCVEIRYDYQGIEKWVTGEWKSKTELTQKYAVAMREWQKSIRICFTKVLAHSNVKYNELADQLAKAGLTDGNGIPGIKRLEEMEEYGAD